MKDIRMIIPIFVITLILAFLLTTAIYAENVIRLEKENKELKTQNERLQKIVKELDREQAEQTKKTAERNGVGG